MMRVLRSLGKWSRLIPLLMVAMLAVASLALAQPRMHPLPGPVRFHVPPDVGDNALAKSKPIVLTAQDRAVLARKQQLAQEYSRVLAGKVSPAQFQHDWAMFIMGEAGGPRTQATFPHISLCPITLTGGTIPTCDNTPHTITLQQESQINRYYCGPAATEEALIALHATTGPHGENLLAAPFPATGQHILAGNAYLATDLNVGTNWWTAVVPHTLNAWEHTHYYIPVNGPGMGGAFSISTFQQDLMLDVAAGRPIIGGIRMDATPTHPHLIGYPTNQVHYHWITLQGYAQAGDETIYADSVHGDTQFWSWAVNVPAYGTVSTQNIMYPLLGTYGYVW